MKLNFVSLITDMTTKTTKNYFFSVLKFQTNSCGEETVLSQHQTLIWVSVKTPPISAILSIMIKYGHDEIIWFSIFQNFYRR